MCKIHSKEKYPTDVILMLEIRRLSIVWFQSKNRKELAHDCIERIRKALMANPGELQVKVETLLKDGGK